MSEFTARPTVYRGIRMRSRLEATFAANLDRIGVPWQYEPFAFGGAGQRQWLPDFRVELASQVAYVDVKGSLRGTEASGGRRATRRTLMTRMAVAWDSEPDAVLVIAEDEWSIVESNPYPISVWAGTRSGWSAAVFARCLGCGARSIAWIIDAPARRLLPPPCCSAGQFQPFYVLRRAG